MLRSPPRSQTNLCTTDYGEVFFCDGEGANYSPNASAGEQDFTYTGREWTAEVGMFYYRARWYRPEVGAFVARDPVLGMANTHSYGYASCIPVDFVDPFGKQESRPSPVKDGRTRDDIANGPSCDCSKIECPDGKHKKPNFEICCLIYRATCIDSIDKSVGAWNSAVDQYAIDGKESRADPFKFSGRSALKAGAGAVAAIGGLASIIWSGGLAALLGGTVVTAKGISEMGEAIEEMGGTPRKATDKELKDAKDAIDKAKGIHDTAEETAKKNFGTDVKRDCCEDDVPASRPLPVSRPASRGGR